MNTTVAAAPNQSTALLFGCGEAGKKLLRDALPKFYSIAVVDADEAALAWAVDEAERVRATGAWAAHVNTATTLDEVLEYAPYSLAMLDLEPAEAERVTGELKAAGQEVFA
jgi:hypothetical protein